MGASLSVSLTCCYRDKNNYLNVSLPRNIVYKWYTFSVLSNRITLHSWCPAHPLTPYADRVWLVICFAQGHSIKTGRVIKTRLSCCSTHWATAAVEQDVQYEEQEQNNGFLSHRWQSANRNLSNPVKSQGCTIPEKTHAYCTYFVSLLDYTHKCIWISITRCFGIPVKPLKTSYLWM